MLDQDQRLELLKLALEGNEHFKTCDIELKMGTPSYTIHTIKKLQAAFPDHRFILIIGSDNLDDFDKWKDYEELLSLVTIYVYPRPGYSDSPFLSHPAVKLVDAPRIDISSTQIRKAISDGKSPRYLLPDQVLQRITKNRYF
jgi:nicotinate-nucleotide adenylyltransferase